MPNASHFRAQALSTFSLAARAMSIMSPFIFNLAVYWKPLPMVILGMPALISVVLIHFLTETKGKTLTEEIYEEDCQLVASEDC